jgi:hypothetical protein
MLSYNLFLSRKMIYLGLYEKSSIKSRIDDEKNLITKKVNHSTKQHIYRVTEKCTSITLETIEYMTGKKSFQ